MGRVFWIIMAILGFALIALITTHDQGLQGGLDPILKAERVKSYLQNMVYEIGVIAHSCGVNEPRQLQRFHARIVTANGRSIPLDELYPDHDKRLQPSVADQKVVG